MWQKVDRMTHVDEVMKSGTIKVVDTQTKKTYKIYYKIQLSIIGDGLYLEID